MFSYGYWQALGPAIAAGKAGVKGRGEQGNWPSGFQAAGRLFDDHHMLVLLGYSADQGGLGHEGEGGAAAPEGEKIKLLLAGGTGVGRFLIAVAPELQKPAVVVGQPPEQAGLGGHRQRDGKLLEERHRLFSLGPRRWRLDWRGRLVGLNEVAVQELGSGSVSLERLDESQAQETGAKYQGPKSFCRHDGCISAEGQEGRICPARGC